MSGGADDQQQDQRSLFAQYQREQQGDDFYQPYQSHRSTDGQHRSAGSKRTGASDEPTNSLMLTRVPDSLNSDLLSDALKAYAPVTFLNYLGEGRARVTFDDEHGAAAVMAASTNGELTVAGVSICLRYTAHVTTKRRNCGKDNYADRSSCRQCRAPRDETSTTPHKRSNSRYHHQHHQHHQHHNDAGASRLPQNGEPVAVELPPDGYVPHMSGYFHNVMTGFFFDTKTSYYFIFDAPSQRFLFYDYKVKTYRVYPPETLDAAKPTFLAPAALVNTAVDAQPPLSEAVNTAAVAPPSEPKEYKKGAKPLKMTLTAKKAATNMAQWSRMKEIDTEAPPATLDAFVKATEEDNDAAAEAEAAQRRVRNTGRAPVVDVQPRPMSAQYSSLGRGPKNPTAADVPSAPSEVTVAPPVLVTMTSVVELTSVAATPAITTSITPAVVDQFDTLSVLASGNVACTLCQRQFPNRDKAEKHVTMSALHAGNVEARDNAAREAATLAAEQVRQREQRQVDDRRTVKQRERDAREEMLAVERRLAERAAQGLLAPPPPVDPNGPKISDDNVGNQMLRKMGWREGTGLGAQGSGIVAPVQSSGGAGSLAGIGSSSRFTASATAAATYSAQARDRASQRFDAIVQAERDDSK